MKPFPLIPLCLSTLLGVATGASVASAQGGGFNAGELFVYTGGIQSPGYNGYGILRVDPVTGASSVFVQTAGLYSFTGAMAFDPYRQRLVFSAPVGGPTQQIWLADGAGNLQDLSAGAYPLGIYLHSIAPTNDGRIYCSFDSGNTPTPLLWYDAANNLRVLYDSDGVTPMKIDGGYYFTDGMIWDAGTNSLFIASRTPAPGFPQAAVNVRKLPLSADGSRVIGPVGNSTFEVSLAAPQHSSGEKPVGWSYGPNGQLVLCVLTVDTPVMPRMLLVDPVTSAISVWGSNGSTLPMSAYANTPGGAYTAALDQVVIVDYSNAVLRGYAQGSGGGVGNPIATSPATSAYWTSLNVTAVPPDDCAGGWIAYGLGLKGAGNIVPMLTGAGCPEPGAPITLKLSNAVGGASAALFVGLSKGALPFKGGTFQLGSVLLTLNFAVGGTPGVAGAGALSLPSALPAIPALTGTSVFLQAAFSDAAAVQHVSLTQGLELEIG